MLVGKRVIDTILGTNEANCTSKSVKMCEGNYRKKKKKKMKLQLVLIVLSGDLTQNQGG